MQLLGSLLVSAFFTAGYPLTTARAEVCTWDGPPDGNWNVAANWNTNHVPLATDTADIPAHTPAYSVLIDGPVEFGALTIGNGAALTVAAGTTLGIGDGVTLTVSAGAKLNLAGDVSLHGSLTNAGTVNWTGGEISLLDDEVTPSNGVITNSIGGVFDISCNQPLTNRNVLPRFHNAGKLRKSAGTGLTDINVFLESTGTVEVTSGTLQLSGGGNLGGTFKTKIGAALLLASGNFTLANTPVFQGMDGTTGQLGVNGEVKLIGALTGIFGFYAGGILNTGSLLTVASGGALTIVDNITLLGSLSVAEGGTLNITATVELKAPLANAGTVTWLAGDINVYINENDGWTGEITNAVGGMFDIQCDNIMTFEYETPQFHNAGILRKNAGAGAGITRIDVTFDNPGTVEVQSGTLCLNGGVTQHSEAALTGGTWCLSNGAVLDFPLGENITVNQATVTLDGASCVFARFTSALAGNQGKLTLSNGRSLTTSGNLTNSGTLRIEGAATTLGVTGTYAQTAGSTTLIDGAAITAAGFTQSGGTLGGDGTIRVVGTPPLFLTLPANIVVAASEASAATVDFSLGASGGDGAAVNSSPPSGSTFQLGVNTVSVTARDDAGNTALTSFTVTVVGMQTWTIIPAAPARTARISGTLLGGPGIGVKLQASSDLGLSDAWQDIGTVVLDTSGSAAFSITDPASAGLARDFFRVRLP